MKLEEEAVTALSWGLGCGDQGDIYLGKPQLTSDELHDLARPLPLPSSELPSLQDRKNIPHPVSLVGLP